MVVQNSLLTSARIKRETKWNDPAWRGCSPAHTFSNKTSNCYPASEGKAADRAFVRTTRTSILLLEKRSGERGRAEPNTMAHGHAGYDHCKNVFIFYVVLIHLCNFDLIKWTGTNAAWSPVMNNFMRSYSLWHEKLSGPGLVFIPRFFGKGFLPTVEKGKKADLRWQKTISVLFVGSAVVQLVEILGVCIVSRLVTGKWPERPLWFPLWDKLETWYLVALFLWRLSTPLIG